MILIDTHCDTAGLLLDRKEMLADNSCHVSLKHLLGFESYVQFFAAWVSKEEKHPFLRAVQILTNLKKEIKENSEHIEEILDAKDLESILKRGIHGAIFSLEDGRSLEGKLDNLHAFYELGVRAIALAWNDNNDLTDGIGSAEGKGLTEFGKQVVQEMNRLHMIVDVSHITVQGFWDVLSLSKSPVMASHSNCKAICNHRRNLDDEQIKALIVDKGIMGMNLYRDFLVERGEAEIHHVLRHIEYVLSLGGEDILSLGSDFDGMQHLPKDMKHAGDYIKLMEAMQKIGYSDDLIDKITYKNVLNFIKKIEK